MTTKNDGIRGKANEVEKQLRDRVFGSVLRRTEAKLSRQEERAMDPKLRRKYSDGDAVKRRRKTIDEATERGRGEVETQDEEEVGSTAVESETTRRQRQEGQDQEKREEEWKGTEGDEGRRQ